MARRSTNGLYDAIKAGSRVTIVNRFGQKHMGRAIMRGPAGWVLNMGGRHGRPDIATPENVVKVSGGGTRAELIRAGNPGQGAYSVFIGNRGWTYGFPSLTAARTFVAWHPNHRYDIHKGAKLVESGKVHPPTSGSGGKVWLVRNPAARTVKILGYTVKVGTKRHAELLAQKKHFDDLRRSETAVLRRGNPGYSVDSDDGVIQPDIKTLAEAKKLAERLAIDQNTYVFDAAGKKRATYKMKYSKSRNPLPGGRWVTAQARRLANGKIQLRGNR